MRGEATGSNRCMEPLANNLDRVTHYEYVGECVSRRELVRGLERWVNRSGALPADLAVRVAGRDAPEFWARFEIQRGERIVAAREFSSGSVACEQRSAVLSSALGLALENYLESARMPEAKPKSESEPEPVVARARPPAAERAVWRGQTYAGGWWGVGALPGATWSAAIGAGLLRDRWVARAGAFLTPIQVVVLGEGRTRVQVLGGEFSGCVAHRLGSRPLELCADARLGLARLSGVDYRVSFSTREPYAGVGLSLTLTEQLGRVGVYVGGQVGLTVWAPELVVRGERDRALVASRAWPGLSLGVLAGLRFDLSSNAPKDSRGAAIDP
jgi:hypothetical protein